MALAAEARAARAPRARVWRPFPREGAEVVGVEDGSEISPRMHPWFAICLVRSRGLGMIEARREVVLDRNCIVLIPSFQLFALRHESKDQGAVTLLLAGSHCQSLDFSAREVLVIDAMLGEGVIALIAQWQEPARSEEHAPTIRSVVERLIASGTPLAAARPRRISSLARVQEYLRAQIRQPVTTEELSQVSGLSEPHLIRAFHYEFGLPPHAYHLRVRLAAACELLTRGRAVASVAYECGFADQSHLSRKFKTVYGLTPAAWAAGAGGGNGHASPGAEASFLWS
jgi:AraC-like DNA-binding protein